MSTINRWLMVALLPILALNMFGVTSALADFSPDNSVKEDPLQASKQLGGGFQVGEFTGAGIDDFPLALPSGRNGLTPAVSLTYNSQDTAVDSPVGYHWSLTEFSIRRTNKKGVDQLYTGNTFSAHTPFSDGELTATDEIAGAYAEKIEGSFARYDFLPDGHWVVTDKSGTRYTFGATAAARQDDPADPSRVARWMIEEIRDTNDNFIRYTYFKADGQIYPKEIFYTAHRDSDGIFKIRFLPFADGSGGSVRPDAPFSYATGFRVATNYLLTGIQVLSEGRIRRQTDFTYLSEAPLVRQTLASVTETGTGPDGSSVTLPPTTFEYTDSQVRWEKTDDYAPQWFFENCVGSGCDGNDVVSWDMNGDGLTDFEYLDPVPTTGGYKPTRATNNGHGGWIFSDAQFIGGDPLYDHSLPSVDHKVIDFEGDAKDDIVGSIMLYDSDINMKKVVSRIDSSLGQTVTNTLPIAMGGGSSFPDNGVSLADVNGDGLPDMLRSVTDQTGVAFAETCLNAGGDSCVMTDLWKAPEVLMDFAHPSNPRQVYVQDCNQDGLADIYFAGSGNRVWVNNGKGGWVGSETCAFNPVESSLGRALDANGDGLFDYATSFNTTTPGGMDITNQLSLNTGVVNAPAILSNLFPYRFGSLGSLQSEFGVRVVDLNGDGLPDLMQAIHGGATGDSQTDLKSVYMNRGQIPYLLKTIHLSSGARTDLTYQSSAQYFHSDGTQANPALPMIIMTVKSVTSDDGMGTSSRTDYAYEDGHFYYKDGTHREFAGFRAISKTDALGFKTKTYFHQGETSVADVGHGKFQDDFTKIGRPYRTEIYDDQNRLLKASVLRWDKTDLGTEHAFVFVSQTVDELTTPATGSKKSTATAMTYDAYGNVLTMTDYGEVQSSDDGSFTDTGNDLLKMEKTYATDAAGYLAGYVSEEKTSDQNGALLSDVRTGYDDLPAGQIAKGNRTQTDEWLDSENRFLTDKVAYNEFGLPVSVTNRGGNTTIIEYDANNLYPSATVNALGQRSESVTDAATGVLLSSLDPNGLKTENTVDGLGRLISVMRSDPVNPAAMVTLKTIQYDDQNMPRSVTETDLNDDSTTFVSARYADGFGRAIESKNSAADGQWVAVGTVFDSRGNAVKTLQPYFSSSSAFEPVDRSKLGTDFTYDGLRRVLTALTPLGTSQSTYDGWSVTTTDADGGKKGSDYDSRGRLIAVREFNGDETYNTSYVYDPRGSLTGITDALGNAREFTHDSLGRLLTQTDAHLPGATGGLWKYIYDDQSNVVSRTDAKNQPSVYTYDALDRLLTEDFSATPETEFTYTYDQGANALGRLSEVAGKDYDHQLTHDLWGRVTRDHKVIGPQSFDTGTVYDRLGGVKQLMYPDGAKVDYAYDSAHLLTRVSMGQTAYAQDFQYSPLGQVTQLKLGNGVVTTMTYDPDQQFRMTSKKSVSAQNENLQDYAYMYDPVGNLMKLTDANTGITAKTVDFQYDGLYRLTEAKYSATANKKDVTETYVYNAIGNILSKSDVGEYQYDGPNPHAVTAAGTGTFAYDENGNMTQRQGKDMTYDYRNRLIASGNDVTFGYGEGYDRIWKKNLTSGNTTYYPNQFYELDDTKAVKYIFAGSMRVAKIEQLFKVAAPPVAGAPESPVMDPATPAETDQSTLTLSGTKPANTSVWINGVEAVPLNADLTWTYTVTLTEGENTFTVETHDERGQASSPVTVVIRYSPASSASGGGSGGGSSDGGNAGPGAPPSASGGGGGLSTIAQTAQVGSGGGGGWVRIKPKTVVKKPAIPKKSPRIPAPLDLGDEPLLLFTPDFSSLNYDEVKWTLDHRVDARWLKDKKTLRLAATDAFIPQSGLTLRIDYRQCVLKIVCRTAETKEFLVRAKGA